MNETQALAAQQFANIEIIKLMMLDLWEAHLLAQPEPDVSAIDARRRHLDRLQKAVDMLPDSLISHALLSHAEENWKELLVRLGANGFKFERQL